MLPVSQPWHVSEYREGERRTDRGCYHPGSLLAKRVDHSPDVDPSSLLPHLHLLQQSVHCHKHCTQTCSSTEMRREGERKERDVKIIICGCT